MSLKEQIAAARHEIESTEPTALNVEVGGALVALTFRAVTGMEWATLTAVHPPRKGSTLDNNVGFDSDALSAGYPVEKITADGEPVAAEDWAQLFDVLTAPNIKNIAAVLWGIHQLDPSRRLQELGKALAGNSKKKSSLPAK